MKILDDNGKPFTSYFTDCTTPSISGTTAADFHKAIYVGVAGDIAFQISTGGSEYVKTVPAGAWLPIKVAYINSTATTASDIFLWK